MLYIVSTPIGNLKDITLRAIEVLKSVDLIASEDTRHTGILLKHYEIKTPQTSYFEYNKDKKSEYILSLLRQGKDVALVTDAGTPGVSDPGYNLIKAASLEKIPITVVPGVSAFLAALSLSAMPSNNFVFEGFLPVKSVARRNKLEEFLSENRTVIFYESPYRLVKTLLDIKDVLNNPYVVCVREITKKFEEVKSGTAHELADYFSSAKVKGEFVILIGKNPPDTSS